MQRRSERKAGSSSGSITLFLALVLTLVLSFCFSLLEAARVQCLSQMAQRRLLLDLESAFGEYHPALWQDYRLLFLDGSAGTGGLDLPLLEGHIMEESDLGQKGAGFLQMAFRGIEISGYTLATDFHGAAFEAQASKAAKEQLAAGAADELKKKLEKGEEMAAQKQDIESKWNQAQDAVNDAGDIQEKDKINDAREGAPAGGGKELPENPMEVAGLLKRSSILNVVVENPSELSSKSIPAANSLKDRKKEVGTLEKPKTGSLEKIWFLQYLNYYFSCYTGAGEHGGKTHALDYELEYIIAGKETDIKNLEKVVKELLLIREVGNFATILQDGKKQALALEMAAATIGFTGIAPLVEAVKLGILLAWSYMESIMDLRSLLAGGTVPLIKKPSDWKSDVTLGWKALGQKPEKTEEENGWGYREYLLLLLALVRENTLVYRAMDVVEQNLRQMPGGEKFRMDCQIYRVEAEGLYTSQPLFLGFVTVGGKADGVYHFQKSQRFSY